MPIELQTYDSIEPEELDWGWIRWLMSDRIQPGSAQTVGIVEIEAGKSNPLHYHSNCEEQLYVLSGVCEHLRADETATMKAGDLIRIPQGVRHRARAVGDEPMRAMIIFSTGDRQTVMCE